MLVIHSRRFRHWKPFVKVNGLGIKLQAETGGTYYDAIQATAFGTNPRKVL